MGLLREGIEGGGSRHVVAPYQTVLLKDPLVGGAAVECQVAILQLPARGQRLGARLREVRIEGVIDGLGDLRVTVPQVGRWTRLECVSIRPVLDLSFRMAAEESGLLTINAGPLLLKGLRRLSWRLPWAWFNILPGRITLGRSWLTLRLSCGLRCTEGGPGSGESVAVVEVGPAGGKTSPGTGTVRAVELVKDEVRTLNEVLPFQKYPISRAAPGTIQSSRITNG